jgi:hypothetical protein
LGHALQAKTIRVYLSGLRSLHVNMGHPVLDIFENPRLDRVLRGIKRFHAQSNREKRLPVTRNILLILLHYLPKYTTDMDQANLYDSFCIAFAGFLRVGKFTYTSRDACAFDFHRWHISNSSFNTNLLDNIPLTLPASKTDTFRTGITVHLPITGDITCPLAALRSVVRFNDMSPHAPLFQRSLGRPFTREFVITSLSSTLTAAGIPGYFSGHSFRRGAATTAQWAGLSSSDIQLLGRWRSDAFLAYVDADPADIVRLACWLHGSATNLS